MNAADRSQLLELLHGRRDEIAGNWHQAIAIGGYIPLEPSETRQRLLELTEQAIDLLVSELYDYGDARAIGAALAQLHCIQPEALDGTLEVLTYELVRDLPADRAVALLPRLAELIGAVASGFFQQAREMILAEQEQTREALIAASEQAIEALGESEERFRTIVETAPGFLVITDDQSQTVYASPNCLEMTGYTQQELEGELIWWVHGDDFLKVQKAFEGARREGGGERNFEYKAVKKDGEVWFASSSWEPLRNRDGTLRGVVLQTTDITQSKQIEQALRESEGRYRSLFESAPLGIAVVDADGHILAFNDALLESIGYTREDVARMGKTPGLYYNSDDRAEVWAIIAKQDFLHQHEVQVKRRDGSFFSVLLNAVPVVWGGQRRWQVTALDISARKQAERRLLQAERMAAMGWMATALAHEVNNPLQAIQSNLELALDFDLRPDEQERCLDVVRQEIDRLARVTRQVLEFAHPADDTLYPFSLEQLIRKTLSLLGKQLELAHIQVTTDLPADLPRVFVSPDQIAQVLLNVSVNAIEAMPDGGHLRITVRVDEDAVVLTLANDGPSLPVEHIERVFDPFFTTKPNGTGLGLSISHSIVHRHGGALEVENLEGDRGVAFTITLPIAQNATRQEAPRD